MQEPAGRGTPSLGAIRARLDEEIPQLYRDLALYLQVLREVLPAGLDQACSHMATQVYPRQYNGLPVEARQQLHTRLRGLLSHCSALLTVEQLLHLARQMARERERQAQDASPHHPAERSLEISFAGEEGLPEGSVQLNLTPPLTGEPFQFALPSPWGSDPSASMTRTFDVSGSPPQEGEPDRSPFPLDLPWSTGQLPRDPVLLLHCLDGLGAALSRRLRNLSHAVNLELMRADLVPGVVPLPLLDAVLSGQIEPQPAPANLLRLPIPAPEGIDHSPPPIGVLLRTVDLEMEQPRLRSCRRRLLHHRQEILKMAETFHRLQRRLQAHHAERLWRHDSQLNPSEGI